MVILRDQTLIVVYCLGCFHIMTPVSLKGSPFGTVLQICLAHDARQSPEKKSWERKRGAVFRWLENAVGKTRVVGWQLFFFFRFGCT